MPYLTLTLNGYPVDLPADAEVALSYRANDLRNLDSREAAFSETFTLPLTAQTAQVLGTPHALDSGTTTPYRLLPAVLTSPGGTVLLNGFGIIESTGAGYDVTLTDALGGLFAQVGSKKLRDLDLSAYDHIYSLASSAAAQSHDYTQGYTYVLEDDGRITNRVLSEGVLFYETRLAVYYHAVLQAIVTAALPRYKVAGSLLVEDTYRHAVLPQATTWAQVTPQALLNSHASGRVAARTTIPPRGPGDPMYSTLQFAAEDDPGGHYFAGIIYTAPNYTTDLTVKVRIRAQMRRSPGFGRGVGYNELVIRDLDSEYQPTTGAGNAGAYNVTLFFGTENLTEALSPVQTTEVTLKLPHLAAGKRLIIQVLRNANVETIILPGSSVTWEPGPRAYRGAPVGLAGSLPDISQADFLKLVCNQFNLIIQSDAITKRVRFDLFNDLERNRDKARDWTHKLDLTSRPRLSFTLGDYAQRNTLAYDEPPEQYDDLAELPGDATAPADLLVRNATLPTQAEAFTANVVLPQPHPALADNATLMWLPFLAEPTEFKGIPEPWNATKTYGDTNQPVVYDSIVWHGKALVAGTVPGSSREDKDGVWQPLEYTSLNDTLNTVALVAPVYVPQLVVRDDAPSTATFVPTQGLSRVGFTFKELLPAYYAGLSRILERVQQLVVDVRLTALDIEQLDYTIPVRLGPLDIPGYGRLACIGYLNDIDQYLPGSPGAVACTLLVFGTPVAGLAPPVPMPGGVLYRVLAEEDSDYLLTEAGTYILLEY